MERVLATCITDAAALRDLGTMGFNVPRAIIDGALTDKQGRINDAALEVITQWGLGQRNKVQAFKDLCAILTKIGKAAWIDKLENIERPTGLNLI